MSSKNAAYFTYNADKQYTFKNDATREMYESLDNIDRLQTRVFVETVDDWSTKTNNIIELCADMEKILDVIAPSLSNFENFYPIPVGIQNMRISCTGDPNYQSRLVRKSFNAKGYSGIVILDKIEPDQKIRLKLPYGNFFSSSEDIVVDVTKLKGGDLHAGDIILFPKSLTVFYPRGYDDKNLRFFEFDVAGHD